MKTESPLNRKVQLAFGSAILALLVVGAMSFRGMAVSGQTKNGYGTPTRSLKNFRSYPFLNADY